MLHKGWLIQISVLIEVQQEQTACNKKNRVLYTSPPYL